MNDLREEIRMQFGKNSMKPDDVGRSVGVDGGGPIAKESRSNESQAKEDCN